MILIVSEKGDQTTNEVIDWVRHFNYKFIRINDTDRCSILRLSFNNDVIELSIKVKKKIIDFSKITSHWYRRGNISFDISPLDFSKDFIVKDEILFSLWQEKKVLSNFLHFLLKRIHRLGSFYDNNINKLTNLEIAKACGLSIPNSLITSDYNVLSDFVDDKGRIITKAISEAIMYSINEEGTIQSYTSPVKKGELKSFKRKIFPSLFQVDIVKKYELRIFYLDGEFYSMAIFSQKNEKTKTDFRNYDEESPNRCVPYILPNDIQNKLVQFMKKMDYNTGSIDMLVDECNNFIFLEVNPVGQFGMTSYPCNYYLEKKVAQYLCKKNKVD